MKKSLFKSMLGGICLAAVLSANVSWAIPSLQLDIAGGIYDPVTETVIAGGNPFTLYALFDTTGGVSPVGTYYISAAIIPNPTSPFGSFSIDADGAGPGSPTTYSSGSGMQLGTPPVSLLFPDLPSHSVFPTWYAEVAFTFNAANTAVSYNSQDTSGGFVAGAGTLLYQAFTIDVRGVAAGYTVHFDLYNETVKKNNALVNDTMFAPFSHDAQSGSSVPDGGSTIALLGAMLAGFGALSRKLRKE